MEAKTRDGEKWCNWGQHWQPFDAFQKDASTKTGLKGNCRACCTEQAYRRNHSTRPVSDAVIMRKRRLMGDVLRGDTMTNYRLSKRQRVNADGTVEWQCLRCLDWKDISAFSMRSKDTEKHKPRSKCKQCAIIEDHELKRKKRLGIPTHTGRPPQVVGDDVITLADMQDAEMKPAAEPLKSGGWHCGRRAVIVVLGLDNGMEYGVWCAVCDTVWRSGIRIIRHGRNRPNEQTADKVVFERARPWNDEWEFYKTG